MPTAGPAPHRSAPSSRQRAKSERTRARVLEAAARLIAEGGFHRATSKNLAAESGMSWGAIQYQFGSKERIFEALLDQALSEFATGLQDWQTTAPNSSLEQRIKALVESARELIGQPTYIAYRQVLHDAQLLADLDLEPAVLMGRIHRTFSDQIAKVVGIDARSRRILDLFQAILFATAAGIEEQARLEAFPKWITKRQLELLETQLLDLVENEFDVQ